MFVVEGFDCIPVCFLVVFLVPLCVYMLFPYLLFVIGYVLVNFSVEYRYLRVVGICAS